MAKLNVRGEIKAPIITATETINCDTLNVWFGGAKAFDSGSNANGYWVRVADGTQICYNVLTYSSTGDQTITLPLPFKDTNYVVSWSFENTESSTQLSIRVMAATHKTTSTFINRFVSKVPYIYIAIGRWK